MILAVGVEVLDWWTRELAATVREATRGFPGRRGDGGEAAVVAIRPGETLSFPAARRGKRSVQLSIDPSLVLRRTLASRRLPFGRARRMAELDITGATPIDRQSVHLIFTESDEQETCYYIVRRQVLETAVRQVRASGMEVAGILIADGARLLPADRQSRSEILGLEGRRKRHRALGRGLACLALLCVLANFGYAHWRFHKASVSLAGQVSHAESKAAVATEVIRTFRSRQERVASVRMAKQNGPAFLDIWNELSILLPDTVWLTDLSMKDGTIAVSGFARSAADLIATIQSSRRFETAEFSAPVVKVPGVDGDRFVLQAKVAMR